MEFTIEEICASRVREGEVEYHIKWSGYDESENTWETESNLIEDGMEAIIAAYKKKNNSKKMKTKKNSTSTSRNKTPTRKTAKKTTKKSTNKSTPSSNKKTKTRAKSSTRKEKKKRSKEEDSSSEILEENDDFDSELEQEEDPVLAYHATSSTSSNSNDDESLKCTSIFGSSYNNWYLPYIILSAIYLYTATILTSPTNLPRSADSQTTDYKEANEKFLYYIKIIQIIVKVSAPIVAFLGVASHPNKRNTYSTQMCAGLVWHTASVALPLCDVTNKQFMGISTLASSCIAYVFFAFSFMSPQEELAKAPVLNLKRFIPFGIIGYFIVSKLYLPNGMLLKAYENMETEPIIFGLLFLKNTLPPFVGWASASRVGYGGIGWKSRRATKQILGVVGCLFLLSGMMINLENVIPDVLRPRAVFVMDTMMVLFLATSAILHADANA